MALLERSTGKKNCLNCKLVGANKRVNYRMSASPLMDGILALDPAGPVFEDNAISRLDRNDAKAVQVLHTDTDTFGYE